MSGLQFDNISVLPTASNRQAATQLTDRQTERPRETESRGWARSVHRKFRLDKQCPTNVLKESRFEYFPRDFCRKIALTNRSAVSQRVVYGKGWIRERESSGVGEVMSDRRSKRAIRSYDSWAHLCRVPRHHLNNPRTTEPLSSGNIQCRSATDANTHMHTAK